MRGGMGSRTNLWPWRPLSAVATVFIILFFIAIISNNIDIDIDIFGFIDYTMYGSIRVLLNPPPPRCNIVLSGAGVGIAFRVRLP